MLPPGLILRQAINDNCNQAVGMEAILSVVHSTNRAFVATDRTGRVFAL